MDIKSINIHGSCVSRDIFRYMLDDEIEIKNYMARQSILSVISEPYKCNIDEIGLDSKFQSNLVFYDLNKLLFEKLRKNKSDILIIDCIDERFNLIKCNESLSTYSNELRNSKIIETMDFKMIKRTEIKDEIIEKSINKYLDEILKIYNKENIIIHEAYFLDKYKDNQGQIISFNPKITAENELYNKILYKYNQYLISKMPKAHHINISKQYFAYENHRWGIAPYHYEDAYYKDVLNIMNSIY